MVKILKKINILMDGRQKRQMVGLFCMMAVSAFLETGAVMMVMAVVEMVIDPDTLALERNSGILGSCNSAFDFSLYCEEFFPVLFTEEPVSFCVYQPVPYGCKPDEEFCKKRL